MELESRLRPFVRTFDQARGYEQDEPGKADFSYVLEHDEIPGLCMGRVVLEGPIHKTPAAHDSWHQAYLILNGTGTVHLAGAARRLDGPALVVIPVGTMHSVELGEGERLEYVYINQYRM